MSAGRRLSAGGRQRRADVEPGGAGSSGVPWSFSGRVVVEQSWRALAWPLAAVGTPSGVALAAFWASGSPRAMVWTGTALGVVALVLDHRYVRPGPSRPAVRASSALSTSDGAAPVGAGPGGRVEPARSWGRVWGWSCPVCALDSAPQGREGEAVDLAGVHDELHHGGRPSAWVWAADPTPTTPARTTPTRTTDSRTAAASAGGGRQGRSAA